MEQIPRIAQLLAQVLDNSHMFEQKTVKGTLKVLATLIDWNELQHFQGCEAKIREYLRVKGARDGAFQCLGAIVGKGMPELDKLRVIKQTEYIEELHGQANYHYLNAYAEWHDTDEYDEEKAYM